MKKLILCGVVCLGIIGWLNDKRPSQQAVLLNVSYDVSRDFYKAYNALFHQHYAKPITLSQSHGSASKQVLSVANGLPADVVTLTQANDIQFLVHKGLVATNWQQILPNNASPFGSVLVFLVKKGNPKQIYDWADLANPSTKVLFANPKTSSNGRFAYLAINAYAQRQFSTSSQIEQFIQKILANVPVFEAGARSATIAFTQRQLGDVLITPENEALIARQTLGDQFEIIYPNYTAYTPIFVAEVNANTALHHSEYLAKDYLNFLWSDEAQRLAAQQFFRPSQQPILAEYRTQFPAVTTFDIQQRFGDWSQINTTYFADNAQFDRLYFATQHHREE